MDNKLSPPLKLTGDINADIESTFNYFQENINDRTRRPTLFDKEVFIEANEIIDNCPVGFWHLISLEEKHKFKVLPCVNDPNINLCNENCTFGTKQVSIKYGTENRNICLLRASRLPWILDIIKLAGRDDKSVKVWMKPGSGKQSSKLYLRYNQYGVDYVLIFSAEKKFYRLISAFPVFFTSEKRDFSKDCEKYSWSYFRQ